MSRRIVWRCRRSTRSGRPSAPRISNTSRHLAEFWMIEPEIAFADLSDDATLAERLLKYTLKALLNERAEDLAFFDERVEKGPRRETRRHRQFRIRAHGLYRRYQGAGDVVREVRLSGALGHRHAVGA
ncbi:MAG: amino acid--tRNA ligase-related protein [Rhizomicrobium sp.]